MGRPDDFKIEIGPDSELHVDFESKWSCFMRSSTAHDKVKTSLAELEMSGSSFLSDDEDSLVIFLAPALPTAAGCVRALRSAG